MSKSWSKRLATLVKRIPLGEKRGETAGSQAGSQLFRLDFYGPDIGLGVLPGKFVMVQNLAHLEQILLRPYSYFLASDKDHISLLIKEVGGGTRALCDLPLGAEVSLLGPLGNNFPPLEPTTSCWFVAGGVGIAPFGMYPAAPGYRFFFGSRNEAEAVFTAPYHELGITWDIATDDGSLGFQGSVVTLLEQRLKEAASSKPARIYTCGPTKMMEYVAKLARQHQIPCFASLEARMGCGFGVCRGCAHVDASGGWRCICVDGPVYDASVIFA